MPTHTDPDVLQKLARLRPDSAVERAWSPERRQAALRHALTADASGRIPRIDRIASWRRRSRWIGAGVAAAAVATAVFLLVPGSLGSQSVPAAPAPVAPLAPATPEPSSAGEPSPATDSEPELDLAELTVSTAGWKTFSSPEYPITFRYPADWELSYTRYTPVTAKADQLTSAGIVDGCGVSGCTAYVSPPGENIEGGSSVVLMRHGFDDFSGDGQYDGATVLATVPELSVWGSMLSTKPTTAAIVTRSAEGFCVGGCAPGTDDFGPPYEYMLSTTELASELSVGSSNPAAEQPEAVFSFGTNWGPEGEEANTVATILASARPNPDFDPTQPAKDRSGRYRFWTYDSMSRPGTDTDISDWETLTVPDGNISLRVPPRWTITDDRDGIILVKAPSGYLIAVLTNGAAEIDCRPVSKWTPLEKLGAVPDLTIPDATGVDRPVELWWQDATWLPTRVELRQVEDSDGALCSQRSIDYGGTHPVYVGSADNLKNPTQSELDQAVAILSSVERLG